MTDSYTIRPARTADEAQIQTLIPQLADFDIPERRDAKQLWVNDAELLSAILRGDTTTSFVEVAATQDDTVLGVIIVTMRKELFSGAPSAHLEAIVIAPQARGQGLGRTLLARAEQAANERGAQSISLHVFNKNHRARSLYEADGYDLELVRAIKWLD